MFIDEIIFDLYNKISGVHMKKRRLELPNEQAVYWLIKTYIAKAYEISRDKSSFNKDEQEFSRIINSVNKSYWNIIFVILSKCIENINSREPFNQCTLKDKHNVTDMILQDALNRLGISGEIPHINLTERQGNYSVLDMGINPKYAFVSCKSDRYKLPKYVENYDFVLTSDADELRFYNFILSIIVSVRRKNNRFDSLSLIKEVFCEQANLENPSEVFDRVIEVLTEYSIIKVDSHGEDRIITIWPIDEETIGEEYISDVIIRKHKEVMDSRIKEYTPPSTREERRRFTGKARERKNRMSSSKTDSEKFEGDEETEKIRKGIKLSGKNNKGISVKVSKLNRQIERIPSDIANEIDFDFFEDELTVTRKKTNKNDSYSEYKAVFNIESPDFEITLNTEESTYSFMLEKNIVTLVNGKVSVIIDLTDNSVVTQFECGKVNKHPVTFKRKIIKGPRIIYSVVIVDSNEFASEEFRNNYYCGVKMFDDHIDKSIVQLIENINLWTETKETKERVLNVIKNMKDDLELPSLIERIDSCLQSLDEKTDDSNKGKSPYVKY